ncbi:hypothetical protein BH09PAT1_BH09PAT1_6120 [soil metagenome]
MHTIVSYLLLLLGIFSLITFSVLFYEANNPNRLAFKSYAATSVASKSGEMPMAISLPSINKSLAIYPSKITGKTWQTTTNGVSYLTSSPLPGSTGNSIIYGHNWASIFGDLIKVKPGDPIKIIFQNGKEKLFKVQFTTMVNPNQTQILNPSPDARLTLYTCTGFLDSKRFVVTAVLATK